MDISKKGKLSLISLIAIFIFPILVSWFLYSYHENFQLKQLNHGTLINPPIFAPFLSLNSSAQKKWFIIQVNNGKCDETCKKVNFQLHQIEKILSKERERIGVVNVAEQTFPLDKLEKGFTQRGVKNFTLQNKIYLMDPLNNLFMYYPENTDAMYILKDLQRVLEVSQIG